MGYSSYSNDREFTDIVHNKLAIPIIYSKLNWNIQQLNLNLSNNLDLTNAVDYIAIDKINMKTITIQERFRESKYSNYSDFTIRYKRDFNQNEERKLSEYFKLDADYFVYGIIDQNKTEVLNATKFLKYCVININKLKKMIDLNRIIIEENSNKRKCYENNGNLICPVIQNHDYSSSFFPVDILLLMELFEEEDIIILQDGFLSKY